MFSAYKYIIQYNVKTIKISCVLSILLYNPVFDTEINFFLHISLWYVIIPKA
jgi:hypothetical protein